MDFIMKHKIPCSPTRDQQVSNVHSYIPLPIGSRPRTELLLQFRSSTSRNPRIYRPGSTNFILIISRGSLFLEHWLIVVVFMNLLFGVFGSFRPGGVVSRG
ncbi:hypothetical protein BDV26DRAFT_267738 [Aspergillus bertholletiae]|uniref:Uncharacterized protein n=1 Tax=Aspergillus bertholletiae TaxID=1226010 RepID=A0A5N7B2D4_9EURO|nr:hypothetical protein BDV26DRAFT_267738 [Aspergillus bertholletiae]